MTDKGECPKCGGVMEWKSVDFNPLNFLVFTGNPIVRAWKCQKCGHEIGRTDSTFEKVPPPQGGEKAGEVQTSPSSHDRSRALPKSNSDATSSKQGSGIVSKKALIGCLGCLGVILFGFLGLGLIGYFAGQKAPSLPPTPQITLSAEQADACAGRIKVFAPGEIRDLILPILRKNKFSGLHILPQIPEKKLANAIDSAMVPEEEVFGLIDATIFGSAKNSLLFAETGIYYHNDWSGKEAGPGFVPYSDLPGLEFGFQGKHEISLGESHFFNVSGLSENTSALDMLIQVRNALIDAAGGLPRDGILTDATAGNTDHTRQPDSDRQAKTRMVTEGIFTLQLPIDFEKITGAKADRIKSQMVMGGRKLAQASGAAAPESFSEESLTFFAVYESPDQGSYVCFTGDRATEPMDRDTMYATNQSRIKWGNKSGLLSPDSNGITKLQIDDVPALLMDIVDSTGQRLQTYTFFLSDYRRHSFALAIRYNQNQDPKSIAEIESYVRSLEIQSPLGAK